jgi:DNA polymerase III subunit delta
VPAKKKAAAPKTAASDAIWTILGTDDAVVKDRARELVKQYTPAGGDDFSVDIIEGSADNADHAGRILRNAIGALQEFGMFGTGKVVWLKDTNVLADSVTGRAQETQSCLEQLLKVLEGGLTEGVTLVISARDVDKRRSAFLQLKKLGHVEIFDAVDITKSGWEEQVMPNVREKAEALDLQFSDEALRLFVMLAGEKTRQIENELEKLDLFLGDARRKVSLEDVRMIVSETHSGVMWDLGNAVAARDLPRALRVLDQLMYHGENAVGILLAVIIPKIRALWQTGEILSSVGFDFSRNVSYADMGKFVEKLPEEVQLALPQKKEGGVNLWPVVFACKELKNFRVEELRNALGHCLEANKTLVTGRLDPATVLSMLLLRILGKTRLRKLPRAS